MSAATSLEKYTAAMQSLQSHIETNKPVFDAHQKLVYAVVDAENELRDAVAESNSPISNADFRVTVTPQSQTFVDIEELDKLVASGRISKELRDGLVKTVSRPARISISPQKE